MSGHIGMMASIPRCSAELWLKFVAVLYEHGCQRFLQSVSKDYAKRIIDVQLRRTKGDADLSLSNALSAMKGIERVTEALHEHERLMDKKYFEYLVKADVSMVSGMDVEHGRQIWWVREGYKSKEIWKLKHGSPKAHAYIRQCLYQFQLAQARLLAQKDFSNSMGATIVVVFDMSEGGPLDFNLKVQERIVSLGHDMFAPFEGLFVIAGLHSVARVVFNLCKRVFPSSMTEQWMVLDNRYDVLKLVENVKDVPHWWFDDDDPQKAKGARRNPRDPREYWCWERCLSEDNRIQVQDFCNPNPETWLDGCQVVAEDGTKKLGTTSGSVLDTIEEDRDEDISDDGW